MRRVILNLAVSLDGFIEGPNGEFDWCFTEQDYGMTNFLNRIDSIFFGRKSYEVLISMDKNPYPDKTKYVFSSTLKSTDPSMIVLSEDLKTPVDNIKRKAGRDIWLFGGASLVGAFINEGLIDELLLSFHPILLGSGKPLFENINDRIHLTLINAQTYSSGLVQLHYDVKNKRARYSA
jgi:dihydrofolate reductase